MGQRCLQTIEDAYIIGKLMEDHQDFNVIFKKFQSTRRKKVDYIVNTSRTIGKVSPMGKRKFNPEFSDGLTMGKYESENGKKILKLEM